MSKHVFIIKEQLCLSFWQLVKAFRFETKKIEEGGAVRPPTPLEAFRVKLNNNIIKDENRGHCVHGWIYTFQIQGDGFYPQFCQKVNIYVTLFSTAEVDSAFHPSGVGK